MEVFVSQYPGVILGLFVLAVSLFTIFLLVPDEAEKPVPNHALNDTNDVKENRETKPEPKMIEVK